jgi:hypothetical protein
VTQLPIPTVYVRGIPQTITVKEVGHNGPGIWTIAVPAAIGFISAFLGFGAATWGVRKQLEAQEDARRKNLAKEAALRRLDFDLSRIGRQRGALDELLTSLTSLEAAIETFATKTADRDGAVDSAVAAMRTACWGALYRLGYPAGSNDVDVGVRTLLGQSWAHVRTVVIEQGPDSAEARAVLPEFRAQLRSVMKDVAGAQRGLDGDAEAAWSEAETRGLKP